ncbi:hypothetical protein KDH_41690 [Dictyobacter sp. S3.2.2.5]|uniref:DUF2207 domain-containing protein n=1 Tax=Dictyobacter halimunensis TaxID=3026934 RepID=A0ABQ6FVP2_9CHLR|nr:hypothetical protein KDH_41690 [Dictyobacter sp. S3.2.2.5]
MMRRLLVVMPLVLLLLATLAPPAMAAGGKTYSADAFNSTINIQNNGDLDVTEAVTFRFAGGPFSFVYREIPTDRTDNISITGASIDGKAMAEGTDAGDYEIGSGNPLKVTWHFQPQSDVTHTFQLTYRVQGAIQQTQTADLLDWNALPTDYGYTIQKAMVTVNYPTQARLIGSPTVVQGPATVRNPFAPGSVILQASNLPDSTPIEVGMRFQPGSLIKTAPQWQINQREIDTFLGPGLLGALGVSILGVLGAIFYRRKRQPKVVTPAVQAGNVNAPPDNLSPATVGALVTSPARGKADFNQALGTMFDLANRGFLTILENESATGKQTQTPADFSVQLQSVPDQPSAYEALLITTLFGTQPSGISPLPFSEVYSRYQARSGMFNAPLREEYQQRGYVEPTYAPAHRGLGLISLVFFLIGLFGTIGGLIIGANLYMWPLGLIPLGFILASMICLGLRASLRYFSPQGLYTVAQCNAFNAYLGYLLQDAQLRDSSIEVRQEVFTRYLPYATSFGWGNTWIQNFQQLGITALPPWFLGFNQPSRPNNIDGYAYNYHNGYNHNMAGIMMITNTRSYQPTNYGGGSSGNFGGGSFGGGAGAAGGGSSGAG